MKSAPSLDAYVSSHSICNSLFCLSFVVPAAAIVAVTMSEHAMTILKILRSSEHIENQRQCDTKAHILSFQNRIISICCSQATVSMCVKNEQMRAPSDYPLTIDSRQTISFQTVNHIIFIPFN